MLTLTLPSKLNINSVCSCYSQMVNEVLENEPDEVCFDFNGLNFIDPAGVVTLWNMVDYFEQSCNCKIFYRTPRDFRKKPLTYRAINYLDDSLFFKKVMGEKLHPGSCERPTTNGLEKLQAGIFNAPYIDRTIRWLKHNVNLKSNSFSFLGTVFGELFNNINDHSQSPIGGCAFAQHYPSQNEITLCISDAGMGIANSMRKQFTYDEKGKKLDEDRHLIEHATNRDVSTKPTPANRGVGLNNLLGIMHANKGLIKIVSNNGFLEYDYSTGTAAKKSGQNSGSYMGTLVLLKFKTNTLEIEEEEDLEW